MPSLLSYSLSQHTPLSPPPPQYRVYQGKPASRHQNQLLPLAQDPWSPDYQAARHFLDPYHRASRDVSQPLDPNTKSDRSAASSSLNSYLSVDTSGTRKYLPAPLTQSRYLLQEDSRIFDGLLGSAQHREEKSTGGVATYLDYNLQQMVDFVADMVQGMYALYESGICLADIDITRSINSRFLVLPAFRKYVFQLLVSTRLPRTTILVALCYLATRLTMMSVGGRCSHNNGQIYRMLVISLLLGSKFLDDNTLKNCSWSEVSNIPTGELNLLEIEWLSAVNWDMHISPDDTQGFALWHKHWTCWQAGDSPDCKKPFKKFTGIAETPPQFSIYNTRSAVFSCAPLEDVKIIDTLAKNYVRPRWPVSTPARVPSPHERLESWQFSLPATGPNTLDWFMSTGRFQKHAHPRPSFVLGSSLLPILAVSQPALSPNHPSHYVSGYYSKDWNDTGIHCSCHHCIAQYNPLLEESHMQLQSVAF